MDRRQFTTIMYLTVSMALILYAILQEQPLLGPAAILFLILGGFHSQKRDRKEF